MADPPPDSEPPDAPDAPPQRRWLKPLLALLLLGVAIGAGLWWRRHSAEQERLTRLQTAGQAWADAHACLIGDPLGPDESLIRRMRLIELTGAARDHKDWPASCATHLQTLYDALAFGALQHELKQALIEKFGCDQRCEITDPVRAMSGLEAMVRDAELPAANPRVAPLPRVDIKLLSKTAFAELAAADARERDRIVLEDGSAQLLLTSRRHGLQLCEVQPDDGSPWRCHALRSELTPSTVKLVRAGDELLLRGRLNAQARKVVVDQDGEIVKLKRGVRDGFALQRSDGDYKLSYVADGKVQHDAELSLNEGDHGLTLAGKSMLWVRPGEPGSPANSAATLMARTLSADKPLLGKERALGPVPASVSRPLLCKSGEQQVALYGPARRPRAMVFFDGSQWGAPVPAADSPPEPAVAQSPGAQPPGAKPTDAKSAASSAPSPSAAPRSDKPKPAPSDQDRAAKQVGDFGMLSLLGSAAPSSEPSPWAKLAPPPAKSRTWSTVRRPKKSGLQQRLPSYAFRCAPDEGVITWRIPGPASQTIAQLRCTPKGCQERRARLDGLSVKAWWGAATVGDKVLVVWRTERGDLRMRHAPIEQLPSAPDRLIMDTVEHGGPDTRDLAAVIGRQAVVFLFRGKGINGLRFDADGHYAPVTAQP